MYSHLFIFLVCFCHFTTLVAVENRATVLLKHQINEITLKNGLKVYLKQSQLEPNEFNFQIVAKGGYVSLPITEQPSAWLAADIAWESGINQQNGDELECVLDNHSLDMSMKLGRFDRLIEASGPITELPYSFQIIQTLFNQPSFNPHGFKEALSFARHQLLKEEKNTPSLDREIFNRVNMRNWYALTPFNLLDLNKIEYKKAENAFKAFFSNIADFTLILIGDFNLATITSLLNKTLGSLPAHTPTQYELPLYPPFPDGMIKKDFSGCNRYKQSHTHITFPLSDQLNDPIALDLLCIILKQRLLNEKNIKDNEKNEIKVSYRFPLFPYLTPLWLVIKFSSSQEEVATTNQMILRGLENIKKTGISEQEFKKAYEELLSRRHAIPADNSYELGLLANYCRAGWDIVHLYQLPDSEELQNKLFKKILNHYPSLLQYSIISLHP